MPQATSLHIDYTSSQGHPARLQTNVTGNETEWLETCTKYRLALPSYDLFALFATFLSQASIKLSWLISSFWLQSTCTSQPLCASPADLPQCQCWPRKPQTQNLPPCQRWPRKPQPPWRCRQPESPPASSCSSFLYFFDRICPWSWLWFSGRSFPWLSFCEDADSVPSQGHHSACRNEENQGRDEGNILILRIDRTQGMLLWNGHRLVP